MTDHRNRDFHPMNLTPMPSFHWHHMDNDGNEVPEDEQCWWFTFDVGSDYLDFQLFKDGTCEWFATTRPAKESGTPKNPRGNDREPFAKVANDPEFRDAVEAIRRGYDQRLGR